MNSDIAEARERNAKGYLLDAGLCPIHSGMTFESLSPNTKVADEVLGFSTKLNNLFLWGGPGRGKTHQAVAAMKRAVLTQSLRARFFVVAELFATLRDRAGRHEDAEYLDGIGRWPILVLDDMGVERPTDFVLESLYLLIDRWHRNRKTGLIITSNKNLDELSQRLDDRLCSRIADMCDVVEITGNDRRIE